MGIKFTNFGSGQLASSVLSGATTLVLESGQGARFPTLGAGDYFYATLENASLNNEIVKVTARSSDTLTVTRGQDNTTARAWAAGDTVALRLNAAALDEALAKSGISASETVTLTNKTISVDNNVISGVVASSFVMSDSSGNIDGSAAQKSIPGGEVVGTTDTQTLTNKTAEKLVLSKGFKEDVFAITDGLSVVLDPNNGSMQTWTLGANRTPTQANWGAGQSITLMVNDTSSGYTINWASVPVTWVGGAAPSLLPTGGYTIIELWKIAAVSTVYGALVGQVA